MKLLLILMPAFMFALRPGEKLNQWLITGFLAMMLISTGYGLFYYFNNFDTMAATYKVSKIMKLLALDDHIRISWATVISCILAYYLISTQKNRNIIYLLTLYIILQIFFIHLIGSKTGLITLYITAFIAGLYTFKNKLMWLVVFSAILVIVPIVAYKTIPSIEQRFNFIKYDFEFYISGQYREGLSDAVRYYSLLGGKDIISQKPLIGTGFCRLQPDINEWYRIHMPEIKPQNYFLPSSEIVIYWASAGIIGLIIFLIHIVSPFFINYLKKDKWFIMYFIPAIFSFTYETHLEGQLPLFFYSFVTSWFWWMAYRKQYTADK